MMALPTQPQLTIQPASNNLIFTYTHFQAIANIKLSLPLPPTSWSTPLHFSIQTTNKFAYHVSQARGIIKEKEHFISIYIRRMVRLEECLGDSFKVVVWKEGAGGRKVVADKKYCVAIQNAKEKTMKDRDINDASSKTGSTYTVPTVIHGHGHGFGEGMGQGHHKIRSVFHEDVARVITTGSEQQVSVKSQLEDTLKQIQVKKNKLTALKRQGDKQRAKKRFLRYGAILALILGILCGVLARISIGRKVQHLFAQFVNTPSGTKMNEIGGKGINTNSTNSNNTMIHSQL